MISVTGMSTLLGLRLVDATEQKQRDMIAAEGQHARAIGYFRDNIAKVNSVDDLLADYDLYSFVMKAYDLEDQIFGKAMIEGILKSNVEDDDALINKMTDERFEALYEGMGFGTDGENNLNVLSSRWRNEMVDRYVERQFINGIWAENEDLATVLEVRDTVLSGRITNTYDILGNTTSIDFFITAAGLPREMSSLDVDRQRAILEDKLDVDRLIAGDETYLASLTAKFVAIRDAESGTAAANNVALTLLSSSTSRAIVTIDLEAISGARYGYAARG